jgi:predicted alpha/beta-fold hydrolase
MRKHIPEIKKYRPEFVGVFEQALTKVTNMESFDEHLTAPFMGIEGGSKEYYRRANFKPNLHLNKTPFLAV